eukprot:4495176-Prymnesium_polylepis.1
MSGRFGRPRSKGSGSEEAGRTMPESRTRVSPDLGKEEDDKKPDGENNVAIKPERRISFSGDADGLDKGTEVQAFDPANPTTPRGADGERSSSTTDGQANSSRASGGKEPTNPLRRPSMVDNALRRPSIGTPPNLRRLDSASNVATRAVEYVSNSKKRQQDVAEVKRHQDLVSSLNIRNTTDFRSDDDFVLLQQAILEKDPSFQKRRDSGGELRRCSGEAYTFGSSSKLTDVLNRVSPLKLLSAESPHVLNRRLFRLSSKEDTMMHQTSVLRRRAAKPCCFNTFERTFAYRHVWLLRHQSA